MASIITAFAVPIVTLELEGADALNAQLRQLFLECEQQGDKYANPDPYTQRNPALFESAFNLFDWNHPAVAKLQEFCLSSLYQAIGELNGYDQQTLQKLHVAHESWFHVTRKGGYFATHNHPMHSWSGVYCVCQEGDDPDSDSGRLTFQSPFAANTMFLDMALMNLKPPYQIGSIPARLKPGQLLLFPSWLLHSVSAFEPKQDGLRITVAFNTHFRMQGVERHAPAFPSHR